jgi:hypothetical protein
MAENLSMLTKRWLFKARMECGTDAAAQKGWLWEQYQAIEATGTAEVTATGYHGQTASMQHRGESPSDNLHAIQAAIEHLESEIAGAAASNFAKPFGFRFAPAPAAALDRANLH